MANIVSLPNAGASHIAFAPFTGLRVKEAELLELGMSLPGLAKRGAALAELPALGLLTLAGMTDDSWTCSYHPSGSGSVEELVEDVLQTRPDLVAVSALTASIEEAYAFCDLLKGRSATVIGGLHATTCPEEAAQHADAVVVGEGETVWARLLADAARGDLSPRYSSDAAFDLSLAPIPRFELLGDRPTPRFTLQTERGCPLACEFCGASRLLGPFREKPLNRIVAELKAIREYSSRPWLELADDNTFVGNRDPEPLLEALAIAGVKYFTEVDWRIGLKPTLLRQLAASGCVQVLVGVESLVFRYPGMGAKRAEWSCMLDAIAAIQDAGVVVNGCLILGADGETNESIDRLVEFVRDSPFAELQLTLQTPFPGTALYQRLRQQGRLLPERGWSHYTLFDVTYQPDAMTVAELEQGFRRAMSEVFSPEQSARRGWMRREIWSRNSGLRRSKGEGRQ